jgi:outer membrane biosynthesis protein TonB
MDHAESSPSLTVVALVSLALHAAIAFGLSSGAHAARPSHREPIRVTVRELPRPVPKPAPVEPVAEPAEVPVAQPVAARAPPGTVKRVARSESASAPSPNEAPSPAAAAPEALDFTGVTLTNPSGGFAQVAGNGQAMQGPLGASPGSARRGGGQGSSKGAAQGAELVALGSLSRPPRAPSLDQALAANYPRSAHDMGTSGQAVVRARILANGEVGTTSVIVASAPEFGKACQRTLAGSRWSAPLDATGRPVATELSYKCVFEVTH